ncbi:flagellar basal-body rod protein FlgG [Rhodospirillaceae bacterium KN72]|uniref:Flagellar basal-body rod protein FlgG n=1 Tax=Pacificispira spongiicola TaxID=2729598 RepID=A0A7Y0HH37_9PROT|nr:flagellar basal-body rod protein FlgG [Pacificispira spongiicola]NMM46313.1 flagellar basal-body rod protein FlgG [Pacificispira spongiicola]
MRSLSIGATGMLAQQLNVEVISHNIANMNTTSYQRRRAEFQDLLYQNLRRVGSESSDADTTVPVGVQVGLGVKTAAVYRITEQGNLTLTENPLDVAINGEGYFQVDLPSGETAYTRAGSFQLDGQGDLVTVDGFTVNPGITIPANAVDISINASGQVLVSIDGQTGTSNVGQLELARFANDAGLLAIGDNLFMETPASGTPNTAVPGTTGFGTIQQGFLETSNVNVVEEITNLITAQRAYEMNSKVIETSDQMMSTLTNLR